MKITILSLWAHKLFSSKEPQPFGGAELQLYLLSKTLVKNTDVEITFITRGQGEYEEYTHEGLRIVKLPYHPEKRERSIKGGFEILKTCLRQETDVYLQRGGGIETGIIAFAAKRRYKPFVFMTSHIWDVNGVHKKNHGWVLGHVYRYGLLRARLIITQTNEQQDKLRQTENLESQVLRSAHEIPQSIPETKQGLLWVARCEPWKNPEAFIKLSQCIPEEHFTMVCPKANSDTYFQKIQRQAKKTKNLEFIPGASFAHVETLFASHKIFVCTSSSEGYPNTFIQAFKWGTPVFSLNLDPDNCLVDYGMGVCSKGDYSKFAATVDYYNKNQERLQQMVKNGREYVRKNHDVSQVSEQLLNLIKPLVK